MRWWCWWWWWWRWRWWLLCATLRASCAPRPRALSDGWRATAQPTNLRTHPRTRRPTSHHHHHHIIHRLPPSKPTVATGIRASGLSVSFSFHFCFPALAASSFAVSVVVFLLFRVHCFTKNCVLSVSLRVPRAPPHLPSLALLVLFVRPVSRRFTFHFRELSWHSEV